MRNFRSLSYLILLAVSSITHSLGARTLESILPDTVTIEEQQILLETSYVYRYDKELQGIRMAPTVPMAESIFSGWENLNPQYLIEVLTLMPYVRNLTTEEYLLLAYNRFRQVSSISGITYIPSQGGKEKELFSEVFRVEKVGRRKPLPDESVNTIPENESMTIHMKEVNLGRGYYDFNYTSDGSDIGLTIRNLNTQRMVFKVLDPGGLEFRFLLVPLDENVLVYVNCAVRIQNETLVRKALTPWGYFHNRIKILYSWFYSGMLGPDASPPVPG